MKSSNQIYYSLKSPKIFRIFADVSARPVRANSLSSMKKSIFCAALTFFALTVLTSFTVDRSSEIRYALYGVAFYNTENLFDTLHDEGKNDFEYLPDGINKWGKMKYEAKLSNIARVLSELCTDKLPAGPAVIGLSEVENETVLQDLLKQPALASRGWQYVTYPGLDRRGIECAFLYNPKFFELDSSMIVNYYYAPSGKVDDPLVGFYTDADGRVRAYPELKGDTTYITRGFLVMEGKLADEKFFFIVNHWPSRGASSEARERAAFQVNALKNALMKQDPAAKVVIMGDLNDDPNNKSVVEQLGCKSDAKKVKHSTDLYNPWYNMLYKVGQGTLMYNGKWNLFDQIILSGNLVGDDRSDLKFYKNEIFIRDYLFQQEGRYKGNPLRTHAGGAWLNGYSDHLPTYVYLIKELK